LLNVLAHMSLGRLCLDVLGPDTTCCLVEDQLAGRQDLSEGSLSVRLPGTFLRPGTGHLLCMGLYSFVSAHSLRNVCGFTADWRRAGWLKTEADADGSRLVALR
jgi:hypothetical protein